MELPQASKPIIVVTVLAQIVAIYLAARHPNATLWLAVVAFLVSGFLADLLTGLMHFGFDYVFPEWLPILGPIAKEFREHHEEPTLDPSAYVVNFTKGSYGSLLAAVLVSILCFALPANAISFFAIATLMGICVWAFFFHQIHSYAHMGSHLLPEDFNRRVREIARLPTKRERTREFNRLFETVPIPPIIRFMQRCHLILNPGTHNLHHLAFETDFSSVNGWSDPVMNWILKPAARRYKAKWPQAGPLTAQQ
jgi:hypothetical protein